MPLLLNSSYQICVLYSIVMADIPSVREATKLQKDTSIPFGPKRVKKDTRVLQPQIPAKRSGDSNLAKSKTMIQGGICRNKSAPGFSAIFTISPYSDPYNIGQLYKPRHPATAATCTPFQHDSRYPPIHTTAPETIFGPEIPTHWNRACSLSE